MKLFLHELPDISELFSITAGKLGLTPQVVEKDYWLMHCLWSLKEQGFQFELKGGTSLAKGFDVIHRFSEDIDIHFQSPVDVKTGPNADKPAHIESRRVFFDSLASKINIPGLISVERDYGFDDIKMRNVGILLNYKTKYETLSDIKSGILLEVGFDTIVPNEPCTISSWCFEEANGSGIEIFDNRAVNISCYLPEYTFVEKLQTISTKFRREQENKILPVNFIRHYYDLYQLLHLERVQSFIGTKEYFEHKEKRFRKMDEVDLTKNEAFCLSDLATRERYISEYKRTSKIYYQQQPDFEEILDYFKKFLSEL